MIYKLVFIFFFLNFNTFAHDYPQYQAIDGYNCDRASDINLTNQCRQSRKWTKPYNGILYDGHIHPQHTKNIDKCHRYKNGIVSHFLNYLKLIIICIDSITLNEFKSLIIV